MENRETQSLNKKDNPPQCWDQGAPDVCLLLLPHVLSSTGGCLSFISWLLVKRLRAAFRGGAVTKIPNVHLLASTPTKTYLQTFV